MPRALRLVFLLFIAGASVLVSLAVGSVPIPLEDTFAALFPVWLATYERAA